MSCCPARGGLGAVAENAELAARRSFYRIGRVIVFSNVLIAIARIGGTMPTSIASAGVGPQLATAAIRFMIILSIGYLLFAVMSLIINRKLAASTPRSCWPVSVSPLDLARKSW
jgi:hypothetical protein